MPENRYWIVESLDPEDDANRIYAVGLAVGFPVVGLVDEEAGGVIAYGGYEAINGIVTTLNRDEATA